MTQDWACVTEVDAAKSHQYKIDRMQNHQKYWDRIKARRKYKYTPQI